MLKYLWLILAWLSEEKAFSQSLSLVDLFIFMHAPFLCCYIITSVQPWHKSEK
jgi:hypothetical protein